MNSAEPVGGGARAAALPDDAQYLQIDLLEPDTLKPIVDKIKPDVVIHLAAIAFVAEKDPTSSIGELDGNAKS